jgi:hypothetical protein
MSHDMEHLHEEIARAVRAGLPPPTPGFEHRLLAAQRPPAPEPRRQPGIRLMTATSVALGLLLVAGLLWTSPGFRGRLQGTVSRGSAPAAQPGPRVTQSPPPSAAGADRFAYQGIATRRIASGPVHWADWNGAARPPEWAPNGSVGVAVSPDGRYVKVPGPSPGAENIVDRSGAVVARSATAFDLWADDSRHLCSLDYSADGWPSAIRIGDVVPGRDVTTSIVAFSGLPARSGGFLAGCSPTSDRAVLLPIITTKAGAIGGASVHVIQLSTGRVVLSLALPAGAMHPVVSPDQRYVATSSLSGAVGAVGAKPTTDVLDLGTGAVVAHLDGTPAGFSGDDQLIALDAGSNAGPASLVEWRTGRTVWRSDPAATVTGPMDMRSLPGGRAVALTVTHPDTTPDVVLVRSDGTATVIARSAEVLTLGSVGAAG